MGKTLPSLQGSEWVLAFGSPFVLLIIRYQAGIISAKGPQPAERKLCFPFIRSIVAINPGNSGGRC